MEEFVITVDEYNLIKDDNIKRMRLNGNYELSIKLNGLYFTILNKTEGHKYYFRIKSVNDGYLSHRKYKWKEINWHEN